MGRLLRQLPLDVPAAPRSRLVKTRAAPASKPPRATRRLLLLDYQTWTSLVSDLERPKTGQRQQQQQR